MCLKFIHKKTRKYFWRFEVLISILALEEEKIETKQACEPTVGEIVEKNAPFLEVCSQKLAENNSDNWGFR